MALVNSKACLCFTFLKPTVIWLSVDEQSRYSPFPNYTNHPDTGNKWHPIEKVSKENLENPLV
jgi:hypothetical protein